MFRRKCVVIFEQRYIHTFKCSGTFWPLACYHTMTFCFVFVREGRGDCDDVFMQGFVSAVQYSEVQCSAVHGGNEWKCFERRGGNQLKSCPSLVLFVDERCAFCCYFCFVFCYFGRLTTCLHRVVSRAPRPPESSRSCRERRGS